MGDQRHVHRFLHAVGGQHGKAGLAAGHDVGMVAEDRQRVIGQRAGGNVEHARQQLAGDLVHVGDHQKQALRGGERAGQRARGKGAVHSAGGAAFGLHLGDADLLAKEVVAALRGPLVGHFGHGGGRRDGVDCGHIAERVCDVADGGIAVHGHLDAQVEDLLYGIGFYQMTYTDSL